MRFNMNFSRKDFIKIAMILIQSLYSVYIHNSSTFYCVDGIIHLMQYHKCYNDWISKTHLLEFRTQFNRYSYVWKISNARNIEFVEFFCCKRYIFYVNPKVGCCTKKNQNSRIAWEPTSFDFTTTKFHKHSSNIHIYLKNVSISTEYCFETGNWI